MYRERKNPRGMTLRHDIFQAGIFRAIAAAVPIAIGRQYEATFAEILSKRCGWVFFCQAFLLSVHEKKSVPAPGKTEKYEHKKSPVSRAWKL